MQLVAETMEPVGAGSLQLAFEQLKEKLKAEGLFDAERKRPLPAFPRTVGIVTSPTGAVIRDFLNIVGRRHSGLNVLLCAVLGAGRVRRRRNRSGARMPECARGMVDVIVLARGGGSLEDLAAFNSERVARAIAASRLPVVSAIGHETDFTIADFVADLRAPTPSAAAELITEAQHKVAEHLARLNARLERAAHFQSCRRGSASRACLPAAPSRASSTLLHRLEQRLDDANLRMESKLSITGSRASAPGRGAARGGSAPRSAAATRARAPALRSAAARHAERAASAHADTRSGSAGAAWTRGFIRSRRSLFSTADMRSCSIEQGSWCAPSARSPPGDNINTRLSDGAFTSRVESGRHNSQTRKTRSHEQALLRKLFGTDGIRAVAGEPPLDANDDLRYRAWPSATRCRR